MALYTVDTAHVLVGQTVMYLDMNKDNLDLEGAVENLVPSLVAAAVGMDILAKNLDAVPGLAQAVEAYLPAAHLELLDNLVLDNSYHLVNYFLVLLALMKSVELVFPEQLLGLDDSLAR